MLSPLAHALGVHSPEVVALVGAGGKTTTMFRLAREMRGVGGVVVTTTTHIFAPEPAPDLCTLFDGDRDRLLALTRDALENEVIPVLGIALTPESKLAGIPPEWVGCLAGLAPVVLVEADGAAHKPLTAPRLRDPVIPASTTLVVAIVGADVLGLPLSAESVHRPDRVGQLAGLQPGEPITPAAVACVLLHPQGPLRDVPASARVVALVNKADSPERQQAARGIADALRVRGLPHIVIGAVAQQEAVLEVVV